MLASLQQVKINLFLQRRALLLVYGTLGRYYLPMPQEVQLPRLELLF